jgi:hypothetical protein|tara:strand:+ start:2095 stop:2454 length:360 start_codon:yes stop_codon:yes gene_type:complete
MAILRMPQGRKGDVAAALRRWSASPNLKHKGNLGRQEKGDMKVTIDIDCTPEEARSFLGLPDVGPLQEAMLERLRQRLFEQLETMDPEAMMKAWMPAGAEGWEKMQKMFWSQFSGTKGE